MIASIESSIAKGYFTKREDVNLHALAIVTNCELRPYRAMARSTKEIAERLEATREALGLSPADICRRTGLRQNAWSQWANPKNKRTITREAAYRLKDEFGVTLDWIYDGDPSGLPARLHQKIREAA